MIILHCFCTIIITRHDEAIFQRKAVKYYRTKPLGSMYSRNLIHHRVCEDTPYYNIIVIIVNHIAYGGGESRVNSPFLALVCQLQYTEILQALPLEYHYTTLRIHQILYIYNMYLSPEVGAQPLISYLHMATNDVYQHNKNNYKFIASTLAALFIIIIIIIYTAKTKG